MSESFLLKIESVCKFFGGVTALEDISFEVRKGIIQGLIGPNGAGKTTLFNVITGNYLADTGNVFFDGNSIYGKKVYEIVSCGIARTFQNVELFESMSVLENVMVGCHVKSSGGFWGAILGTPGVRKEERLIQEKAMNLLDFVGLAEQAHQRSGDLPFGWQRLVEIARALASDPKLLLLDEPAAGLNATEARQLGDLLRKIQGRGITLLLVEHDMSLTMDVCARIVVLDRGRMLCQGTPREVQSDEAVMSAYLGKAR